MRRLLLGVCLVLGGGRTHGLPSVPNLSAYGIPSLPDLPALPTKPTLPGPLPTLPKFLPDLGLPAAVPSEAAAKAQPRNTRKPDYSGLSNIFSFADTRLETVPKGKLPHLEVLNVGAFRTYTQNASRCRAAQAAGQRTDARTCPAHVWQVPYSLESASVRAATDLRRAWQRLEDRYYWRAQVELNNPTLYLAQCLIDTSRGLKTTPPEVRLTVAASDVPEALRGRIPTSSPQNKLQLDDYWPWPQVPARDYCEGVQPTVLPGVPDMYLPGTCFYFVAKFCIEGQQWRRYALNPAAPAPISFNEAAANARVQRAVKAAHTTYFAQYQRDVLEALFNPKNTYLFVLPWRSLVPGEGAVVAPVMSYSTDVRPLRAVAETARTRLDGLLGLNAYAYYFQRAFRSPTLGTHLLPGSQDVQGSPPGVWAYEEFKRLLPPTNPRWSEDLGYATFFEAFNTTKTTFLPEPASAKPLRQVVYFATGINVYGLNPVPVPQPMLLPRFAAGLPFAGLQTQFDWRSIAEGYQVPRVQGTPLFDYAPLIR